jgi:hypothetical protein
VGLTRTAWNENPALAIQLVTRFPSARLHKEVRWLLLNFPDKALSEPEAVQLLLGETLPADVSFQLKVRLFSTGQVFKTNICSTFCTGLLSTRSLLLPFSFPHIATIHSYYSMLCGHWKVILLM